MITLYNKGEEIFGSIDDHDYNLIIIDVPDDLALKTVLVSDLPDNWRDFRDYSFFQQIGNTWFNGFDTPVLKVPSAIIAECYNYVINAQHNDYKRVKVAAVTELVPGHSID